MTRRRYTIRPAEPHEIAAIVLSHVMVERRPPMSARQTLRVVLEIAAEVIVTGVAGLAVLLLLSGLLYWLT